ncbi:MAG TPA: hypothetical protein VFW87_05350 [Pirellulales bacterium]|nr:hypothetical protein [Pirellulales bacterium]
MASEARASCGDYVHVAGMMPHDGPARERDEPEAGDIVTSFAKPMGSPRMPIAPTCQGPNCHRQLPQPTDSAPTVSMSGGHQWACWSSVANWSEAACAAAAFHLSSQPLAGYRRAIERPPRSTK